MIALRARQHSPIDFTLEADGDSVSHEWILSRTEDFSLETALASYSMALNVPSPEVDVPSTSSTSSAGDQLRLRDIEIRIPAVQDLLDRAVDFVRIGRPRSAVRQTLSEVDGWMRKGYIADCESILRLARPDRLDVTASIGLLAALQPVREKTSASRAEFVARLRRYLEEHRPQDVESLMRGVR